jgi:hypothetical protein
MAHVILDIDRLIGHLLQLSRVLFTIFLGVC